jgi:acetyltransferase-like isoleucine patch superfamily enzyme
MNGRDFNSEEITIGNDVWIGRDAKILAGAHIPDGCVVAAGSVVTRKEFPPYSIIGGVPAKVIKPRLPEHVVAELLEMKWWEQGEAVFQDAMIDYLLSSPEDEQ